MLCGCRKQTLLKGAWRSLWPFWFSYRSGVPKIRRNALRPRHLRCVGRRHVRRGGIRRNFYFATRRKQCEVFSGDVPRCYRRWAAKTKPRLRNLRSQKTDRDTPKEAIVRMTWRLPRQYALPMPKRNYASRSIPTFRYTGLIRSEYAKP